MSTTLTIRNLAEPIKQKLRIQAAHHRRSMEAEAREILTRGVSLEETSASGVESPQERMKKAIESVSGMWAERGTTDQLMHLTRGED